jgi:uncharacterized C2H2 Zn-finger protein
MRFMQQESGQLVLAPMAPVALRPDHVQAEFFTMKLDEAQRIAGLFSCPRCGVRLGNTKIYARYNRKLKSWICADRVWCKWRRDRSRIQRQLTIPFEEGS